MATQVDKDWSAPTTRSSKYPWEEWDALAQNGAVRLVKGEDYEVETPVMRGMVIGRYRRLGIKLRTSADELSVTYQIVGDDDAVEDDDE